MTDRKVIDFLITIGFILLVLWWSTIAGSDLDKEQRIKDKNHTSLTNPFIDRSNEGDGFMP